MKIEEDISTSRIIGAKVLRQRKFGKFEEQKERHFDRTIWKRK